jgi:hypothetical protein
MLPVREAAGIEGLVVVAVIYFVLNVLQKAGKKAAQSGTPAAEPPSPTSATQSEGASLEGILREIERLKQQKGAAATPARPSSTRTARTSARPAAKPLPKPYRAPAAGSPEQGPLGRHSRATLQDAEEVEDRTNFDELAASRSEGVQRESAEALHRRRERPTVDQDDAAEAVLQRRLKDAEARNRPLSAADHRQFDAQIRATAIPKPAGGGLSNTQLRQAFIWREVLGPPKSLTD